MGNAQNNVNADYGPKPFVTNIRCAALENSNFRKALWTGSHLQLTLMRVPAGGEIGLELHGDTDQFLRVESGTGMVLMGSEKDILNYRKKVGGADVILIPANTWHNVVNTGNCPLVLYSIYAPPHHPHGTVHKTKAQADAAEREAPH